MSSLRLSLADGVPGLSGANLTWVIAVAIVALLALAVAGVLVRQVLAASTGTEKMQEIAQAVREGRSVVARADVHHDHLVRLLELLRIQ